MAPTTVAERASPYNNSVLGHLRNRKFSEDPANQGMALDGTRTVWYKVDLQDVAALSDKARTVMDAAAACFRKEGLEPDMHVLIGASDKRLTLSFAFPPAEAERVNEAITKINAASRRHQEASQGVALAK